MARIGGRQKGTKNKINKELKEKIEKLLTDDFDGMAAELELLTGVYRVDAYVKLLRYILPPARDEEADAQQLDRAQSLIERLFKRDD